MKEFLSQNEIKYKYRDITESMMNLKLFLKHRDNDPIFDHVKEEGSVGLPCIVIGKDQIVFDIEELDIADIKE
nr:glutaredoxin [Tissierella sp.]